MSRCERRDNKKKKSVRRVSKEKKTDRSRGINLNVSFFSPKNWIFTRVNRVIINCNERLSSVYRGCTKGCINNGFLIKPVRSWTLPIPPFRDRDAGEPVRQPCSNFWTAKFRLTRSSFNDSILIERSIGALSFRTLIPIVLRNRNALSCPNEPNQNPFDIL